MTKKILSLVLVLMMILSLVVLTGCGKTPTETPVAATKAPEAAAAPAEPAASDAETETIVWDFLDLDAAGHPVIIVMNEWADEIYARSNGRLKINIRVGGELPFTTAEYLSATSEGAVQMSGCMANSIAADMPCGGLASLCYLATDYESLATMMTVVDPYLNEELASYGVMNLMTIAYPTQELFGRGDAPSTIEDLKNFKLRSSGAEQVKYWQSLGLAPTNIDASEVISSLNKNVIDGVTTAILTVDKSKWYDALDWAWVVRSQVVPAYCVVNLEAFNALPEDIRQVLVDVSNEYKVGFGQRMDEFTQESYTNLENVGMEIVYATDEQLAEFRLAAAPLWENYAKNAGGKAGEALAAVRAALGY